MVNEKREITLADGTYAYLGLVPATSSTGEVNFAPPGPHTITKLGDGSGPNTDPFVLDVGDTFEVSWTPGTPWVYLGTDGNGGIIASPNGSGTILWLSDDPINFGDIPPAAQPGNTALCFAAGTLIATPAGETAVEDLRIGDKILTADARIMPVKWIGRQTVSTRFGPAERLMPVRFAAGSLGDGLPQSDLTVTADHGMLVDGVICQAGALVNGTTITRVPLAQMGETYTVYHIETEEHEIILANGAPAETFIDNVSRRAFDNFAEFGALYGEVPEMEELPYPRAMSARQVPGVIRARLAGKDAA